MLTMYTLDDTLAAQKRARSRTFFTVFMVFMMIMMSMTGNMLGNIMPQLMDSFGINTATAALINPVQQIGFLISTIFGSLIYDRVRKDYLLTITFIVYALATLAVGLVPSFSAYLPVVVVLGIGGSVININTTAYVADLYPEKRTRYINLMHTFYSVGSIIGPLYTSLILGVSLGWQSAYQFDGIFMFAIGAVFVLVFILSRTPFPHAPQGKGEKVGYLQMFRNGKIFLLGIVGALYTGHQFTVTLWMPSYLQIFLGYDATFSGFVSSSFWLGILIGRLIFTFLSHKVRSERFICVSALVSAVFLGLAILINIPSMWIALLLLTGIVSGPQYPLNLSNACAFYPKNTGSATAVVSLISSLGSMFFAWLLGILAEVYSFQVAIVIPVGTLVLLFLLSAFTQKQLVAPGEGRQDPETQNS